MKRIAVALLHVMVWILSFPATMLFASWLSDELRTSIPGSVFALFAVAMSAWALWIFGRCFSYRPITLGRVLGFAAYLVVIWLATLAGLALAYVAAVIYNGGE